ncbi:MAG: DEAD/DEAH box helicase, partial [Nevskiaceae bacterium]
MSLPLPPAAEPVRWPALPGSSAALAVADAVRRHDGVILAVCSGEQQAYRIEEELHFFLAGEHPVVHLPDTEVLPYDHFSPHQEILSARMAALDRLPRMDRGVLVTTADALIQPLAPRAWLEGRRFDLKVGDKLPPHPFRERLAAAGYQSVSEVQMQGEFAVRGSLIDLFPMGSEQAFRIDLFDDEIESIRALDAETQRSTGTVRDIRLMPAREFPTDKPGIETFRRRYREYFTGDPVRSRVYSEVSKGVMPGGIEAWLPLFFERAGTLFDYLPERCLVAEIADTESALAQDWTQIEERHERLAGDLERPLMRPADLFAPPAQALARLAALPRLLLANPTANGPCTALAGGADRIKALLTETGARVLFVAESPGRREALLAWLKPLGITPRALERWPQFFEDETRSMPSAQGSKHAGPRVATVLGPLQDAFALADGRAVVAEAQIFGLTAPAQQKRRARARDPETLLRDLSELRDGSPVVHVQHGVGRYQGLTRLDSGGVTAEYLVLEYAGGDTLYVPVGSLGLVHRYIGSESAQAPLHALGADRWAKARARASERAHDVAAELLQVQARRTARPGIVLAAKDEDYQKFCAGFPFTPTPDQQKAIDDVLADMARDKPMDRVVCGDVGFGKTEVALRAAFAAVQNGRQVAVLVPTTLLAQQHHRTFADRYAGWPVKVAALSRLRGDKEQRSTLADAAEGRVDIVIGTHRLLQDDVKFRNLGLIIVDEEHRFGVRHKERLKRLRAEVDMLTLTATPIPRTLNMSLAG